jgi:histidinol-phosphate aminotransferase
MTSKAAGLSPELQQRLRQDVQSMHAYAVQDSAGMVKLDAMENPHRLPADLQAELGRRLGALALNRYPGSRVNDLRQALAEYAQVPPGFELMLGNGSDELISLLAMACDVPGAAILAPVPGFVMYAMSAQLQGIKFIGVPLTPDFELDLPAMLAAIARDKPAITYLAYPNNPTANLWDDAAVEAIIEAVVALPEAFDLLIVDDNSPDGTADLVRKMQRKHPGRIHLNERKGKPKKRKPVLIPEQYASGG